MMTVLDHMKVAGYDPAAALNADLIQRSGRGTMECSGIQLRTFRCRPYSSMEEVLAVEGTAMIPFTDGGKRPYPEGWPHILEAQATAYFRIREDE